MRARSRDLLGEISLEYSNVVPVAEWVRDRHWQLIELRAKCRAKGHQGCMGLGGAVIQFPAKGAYVAPRRDAEVFPLKAIFTERAPLLFQELQVILNSVWIIGSRLEPHP